MAGTDYEILVSDESIPVDGIGQHYQVFVGTPGSANNVIFTAPFRMSIHSPWASWETVSGNTNVAKLARIDDGETKSASPTDMVSDTLNVNAGANTRNSWTLDTDENILEEGDRIELDLSNAPNNLAEVIVGFYGTPIIG